MNLPLIDVHFSPILSTFSLLTPNISTRLKEIEAEDYMAFHLLINKVLTLISLLSSLTLLGHVRMFQILALK